MGDLFGKKKSNPPIQQISNHSLNTFEKSLDFNTMEEESLEKQSLGENAEIARIYKSQHSLIENELSDSYSLEQNLINEENINNQKIIFKQKAELAQFIVFLSCLKNPGISGQRHHYAR